MIVRPMLRRDLRHVAEMMSEQYRRWHELDPRLSYPSQAERAAFALLDFEWDDLESWACVAEDAPGLVGYLRAAYRRYPPDDPQRMWLPSHHAHSEIFYQLALRAGLDPAATFSTLFDAVQRKLPAGEPWVLTLVPAAAGLAPALESLGFFKGSIFAYRPLDPPPDERVPDGIGVRPAEPRDLPRLAEMFHALHRYHDESDPRLDRSVPGAWASLETLLKQVFRSPRDWVLLVAEDAPGELIGFSLASLDFEETGPRIVNRFPGGAAGFLHEFYVEPQARRGGAGRALFAATHRGLLELAARQPRRQALEGLWLIYRATNPTSATFWPAMGFQPLYEVWRRGGWG